MLRCIFSDYWNTKFCPYDLPTLGAIVLFEIFLCWLTYHVSNKFYKEQAQSVKHGGKRSG